LLWTSRMNRTIRAKKSLGQHFLVDPNIARKIVALVQPEEGDVILEIGPGKGILTQFFLHTPARVVAVEVDERLVELLQQRFAAAENIEIVAADFRRFEIARLKGSGVRLKWLGNLPYNLTSVVLFRLVEEAAADVARAVFMVQREVAERIVAQPGTKDYGILSVLVQTFFSARKAFSVPRTVFRPPPAVESAVILLEKREQVDVNCAIHEFVDLVKRSFNRRRKLLRNSLREWIPPEVQSHVAFNFDRRPEEVPIEDWKRLCLQLKRRRIRIPPLNG